MKISKNYIITHIVFIMFYAYYFYKRLTVESDLEPANDYSNLNPKHHSMIEEPSVSFYLTVIAFVILLLHFYIEYKLMNKDIDKAINSNKILGFGLIIVAILLILFANSPVYFEVAIIFIGLFFLSSTYTLIRYKRKEKIIGSFLDKYKNN